MKYHVKKRWTFVGIATIAIIGSFIFGFCFLKDDYLGYREVLERANPALSLEADLSYRVSQQRKGVQKAVWHIRGEQRLEATLSCSEAELVYEKEGEDQVIVEIMKDVRCLIQEELFYLAPDGSKTFQVPSGIEGYIPQQTVRYVEAETAKYHYTTETLDANQVNMQLYTIPGHELPHSVADYDPSMEGNADKVNITIIEKAFKFKAGKFQLHHALFEDEVLIATRGITARCEEASYRDDTIILTKNIVVDFGGYGVLKTSDELQLKSGSDGGINYIKCLGISKYRCDNDEKNLDLVLLSHGEIFLDHQKHQIYLQSEKNSEGKVDDDKQLYFRDHLGKIFSDKALIHYDFENGQFSLKTIHFDGSVRLLNRGGSILQYALAEHVTYQHEIQQMHFKSQKNKRVLFYDKINNLQVSAPEIKMQRDQKTKKQQFQGFGDVRFHFAEKEYKQLRKRFLLEKKSL